MQITLEALERALAPIEALGQKEDTFEVNGLAITFRILTPEQELEVQKYARQAFAGDDSDASDQGAEYLERFRLATISQAIAAIGDQDLRNVQFIETAEKLPSGVAIKKPTVTVMRELIQKQRWSGPTRVAMFRKYAEIVAKVEKAAEDAIAFEPSDPDAEIERLEARLVVLKAAKETTQAGLSSQVATMTKTLAESDKLPVKTEPAQVPPPTPPAARQPVIPMSAPPPAQDTPERPAQASPAPQKLPSGVKEIPMTPPKVESNPNDYADSFVDTGDSDAMEEAVASENARLFAMRQGRPLPEAPSALTAIRRPPHASAREASQEVTQDFQQDGDAFRRPVEELVNPGKPKGAANFNPNPPNKGTLNPRFNQK